MPEEKRKGGELGLYLIAVKFQNNSFSGNSRRKR